MPSLAGLMGRSGTKLLVRVAQLVEFLFLQGGQFLVLLSGVVTVNNLAGGKFFCTEDALAAVPSSASTAAVTIMGPARALSCPNRGNLTSMGGFSLPLLELEADICFLNCSEGCKTGRGGVDRRPNSIKALVSDPILKPEDL